MYFFFLISMFKQFLLISDRNNSKTELSVFYFYQYNINDNLKIFIVLVYHRNEKEIRFFNKSRIQFPF